MFISRSLRSFCFSLPPPRWEESRTQRGVIIHGGEIWRFCSRSCARLLFYGKFSVSCQINSSTICWSCKLLKLNFISMANWRNGNLFHCARRTTVQWGGLKSPARLGSVNWSLNIKTFSQDSISFQRRVLWYLDDAVTRVGRVWEFKMLNHELRHYKYFNSDMWCGSQLRDFAARQNRLPVPRK